MDTNVGDIGHCEEQLRTTLHCDDKEKLRRKLAQLQREYLKTAQRLQRAERFEAVRTHVRSRISQQNQLDQRDPEVKSDLCVNPSSVSNTSNATVKGIAQLQGHTEVDSDTSRRSQVIRFILPSDAAFPQSPDIHSHDRLGNRPSPALRLRSRRSRLRWEKRGAEACWGKEDSKKRERLDSARTEEEEGTVESKGADVLVESEELFSSAESESPSLLLTHWNTQGHSEAGPTEGKGHQQQREKETEVEGKSCEVALTTGEKRQIVTQHGIKMERVGDGGRSRRQGETPACKKNGVENTEQKATETVESDGNHNKAVGKKEESNGKVEDGKAVNLLDSCTLVEGLLFPAEYYVRTTRRMTFSHSQPDLQAVILSQLSIGRHRRSRGRGRGPNRETQTGERSDQHTQTDFSPTTASTSPDSPNPPHVQAPNVSTRLSQSSSEISDPITACQRDSHACSLPMVATARPPRGRRKRRGRGRGRSQTSRCEQTSGDIQATSTPLSFCQLLHKDDGANPRLRPHETVLEPKETQPASMHLTASQPSSGVNGDPSSSLSERLEKVYPIFLKSSIKANKPIQLNRDSSSWPNLLLPSSSSPSQTSLHPLPSMFSGFLGNNLMYLDIQQDFHLPDEQFASLKLHKLRQAIVESGLEHFSTPSRNTRSSLLRSNPNYGSSDQLTPRHFPPSYTPTITNSPHPNEEEQQPAPQHVDLQNSPAKPVFTDKLISGSLTEVPDEKNIPETDEEQQAERLDSETLVSSTECVSVVEAITEGCDCKHKGHETVTPRSHNQSSTSVCIHRPEPQQNLADGAVRKGNDCVIEHSDEHQAEQTASTNQSDCCGVVHSLKNQRSGNSHVENRDAATTLSSDYLRKEKPEEPSNNCTALQASNDTEYPSESPVNDKNVEYSSENSKVTNILTDGLTENKTMCGPHTSQLLLSSPPAPCPIITPHLPSSALSSSPMLPSIGLTPHHVISSLLPHPPPSAPSLTLPPPHSPSTQALSPPALSPCASFTQPHPSLLPLSLSSQVQASCEPPALSDHCQEVQPATCPTPSSRQLRSSAGQGGVAEKQMMRRTHTLKAAAGGALVDVCCLLGSSGGLCVAAAGKWAVCLWTQTSASDWSLRHTWTFSEPVINVFPVPDAAGLMCVTLGQLEIREVRVLSCSSLMQTLACDGVIQAVVGISESRVVTSSHSAAGSTLQVFTLSDSSSSPTARPLVSPGVCVGALAPVEGLSDALIGTDEGGHLFIWNVKTGQLLCRVPLGDGLSHTACLRGYASCGVLLVLLQHHFLSSLEEEEKVEKVKDVSEEETKTAFFSLVGVNPLSGKSIPAARLHPPEAWSGRLCEADVDHSSVLGLSQSGCACVWELGQRGASKLVEAPAGEDWQMARWGGRGRLVIGHQNGDVSLHCYSASGRRVLRGLFQ
ncbi:uncharacterized protein palb2 [Leuresthes tenuis]|uniref:uncharacterized protein palb2 n=1 Tax=Leuresthes tenuis TaxID=355514 RepID=UPI003B506504